MLQKTRKRGTSEEQGKQIKEVKDFDFLWVLLLGPLLDYIWRRSHENRRSKVYLTIWIAGVPLVLVIIMLYMILF